MDIDQQEIAALERRVGDQAASPLFAKLAYLYLESGRAKDALRVCDAGLANYPFYSTGHLIKGRTLLFLGLNGEARREFEFVRDWLPFNTSVAEMLKSVPLSEDQVLEEPPVEETPVETPDTSTEDLPVDGETVADSDVVPHVETPDTSTEDLPVDGETVADSDVVSHVEAPETEPDEIVEDDFDVYAERMRGKLGATDVTTLEDYLASPLPEGPEPVPATEPEPAESSEDAFAAAGFGIAEETPAETEQPEFGGFGESEQPDETAEDQNTVVEEPQASPEMTSPEVAGFGESDLSEGTTASSDAFGDQTESAPPEFGGFGETETPAEVPAAPTEPADTSGLEAFGIQAEAPEASHIEDAVEPETNTSTESTESDIFAGFVGPDQETGGDTAVEEEPTDSTDQGESAFPDFSGLPGFDDSDTSGEESPEVDEMPGAGEAFSGPPPEEPAAPSMGEDKIGEFAEKLQDAKKITPVIDLSSQMSSAPSSADEAAADAGFVTPTLAEIYAKQGWYDDAINAYKTLAKSRPAEKEKFEERVKELEEEKANAD